MNKNINVQDFSPSAASVKPLVFWLALVVLSCVCTALIAQPALY